MENPIKRIVAFNQKAGLLEKPYDDFLESSFQIEEALEGFDMNELDLFLNGPESTIEPTPKNLSRIIIQSCYNVALEDVDRLDKACDAVVFAVGSMAKLGLNAQEITQALNIVMDANNAKLKTKRVDAQGKLCKDSDFKGPEESLQELLDRARSK